MELTRTKTWNYKVQYRLNEDLHRLNGPASIWNDGSIGWYLFGKLHRDGGPAYINSAGHMDWYQHGKHHREDGPASICTNGDLVYYQNDLLHRTDGPAIICSNGVQEWYVNGKKVDPSKEVDIKKTFHLPKDGYNASHYRQYSYIKSYEGLDGVMYKFDDCFKNLVS